MEIPGLPTALRVHARVIWGYAHLRKWVSRQARATFRISGTALGILESQVGRCLFHGSMQVRYRNRIILSDRPTWPRRSRRRATLEVGFRDYPIDDLATYLVKVFGCRQASENRPSRNPRRCGHGLWGFRVLRGRSSCAAGPVRRLAAARCIRFVAWRMVAWEPAAVGRQQLSADPNVERTLGHSLQRWCCGVT